MKEMIATNAQISMTLMQEILVMSTLANARRTTRGMSFQSGLFMFTMIPDAIIRYSWLMIGFLNYSNTNKT
jgi:hypothetical protein